MLLRCLAIIQSGDHMTDDRYDPLYLSGIRHFNQRNFFDSHEVWEELWLQEHGPARLFYKGLIQAAVCLHHLSRGNRLGAKKLLGGSTRYLGPFGPHYQGLDVDRFLGDLTQCFEQFPKTQAADSPRFPEIRLESPRDRVQT